MTLDTPTTGVQKIEHPQTTSLYKCSRRGSSVADQQLFTDSALYYLLRHTWYGRVPKVSYFPRKSGKSGAYAVSVYQALF